MVEKFTNYQRCMWLTLHKCGVCRYFVDILPGGRYVIKSLTRRVILFWVLWTNNVSKFIYHVLTYHGLLGVEVHFLDQMSIWDWLLMYAHIFFECMVWFFKYPLWENLYRQWELQEDIYKKLGRPREAEMKILRTDRLNFFIYGGICLFGTFAYAIQFFYTPKYALNTYAIIPADTVPLRIIFCLHECLFLCQGYAYQAFTMVLAESFAVSYQHLLEEMNKVLAAIIIRQKSRIASRRSGKGGNVNGKILTVSEDSIVVPGTHYNIQLLIDDYKKITISAQFHSQWAGAVMGIPQGINYGQFVADVFMLIQLMKEPETDYLGVSFYIMDAVFGMVMIFRMLIILSRLYPQSEEFIRRLKAYACLNTPRRKELLKTIPSLKLVSAKLTGYTVKPSSVPVGVNVLINWYIAAAMWKRPEDPSRRT